MEKNLSYPVVYKNANEKYYIHFKLNNRRFRLSNGNKIKLELNPNAFPRNQRRKKAQLLAESIYNHLIKNNYHFYKKQVSEDVELYDKLIKQKLSQPFSNKYKETLKYISKLLREELIRNKKIGIEFTEKLVQSYQNATSYNTFRAHLNVILNHLKQNGFKVELTRLKPLKQNEKLHKPIIDLKSILEDIKDFNFNLYLCCLFTYCCLLRPHREVRLLKWKDFSENLKLISLDGSRIKSKRNRIVPVPENLRKELRVGDADNNIFSNTPIEFNRDYFKTLWSRYKRKSGLDKNITLYSFRHTGAIDLFKRTESIRKLQSAMGHSSIRVSLTYLRGLEVSELKEEDMPMI